MDNNELQHWGIKGMRWGVRRYQNSDGTLTKAGKKRYEKELAKLQAEKKVARNKARTQAKLDKLDEMRKEIDEANAAIESKNPRAKRSSGLKAVSKPKKKSIKDMSDEELQAKIDRLNLEKRYRDLVAESNAANASNSKKQSVVGKILQTAGERSVENLTTQVLNYAGERAINAVIQKLDPNVKEKVVFANNKKKS